MGCWNSTCGITGLPIFDGDPVVATIICRTHATGHLMDNTPSYPFSNFQPTTVLLRGQYNDYGGVVLSKDQLALTDFTRKTVMVFGGGTEQLPPLPEPKEDGELRVHGNEDYSWWMAHEEIFEQIVARGTDEFGRRWDSKNGKWEASETIKECVDRMLGELTDLLLEPKDQYDYMLRHQVSRLLRTQGTSSHAMSCLSEMILDNTGSFDFKTMTSMVGDLLKLEHLCSKLRITLYPSGSCGSQDDDSQVHDLRALLVQEHNAKVKALRYDYDEDAEECAE